MKIKTLVSLITLSGLLGSINQAAPLSPAELDAMNFYLAGKYGLTVATTPTALQVQLVSATSVALSWGSTAGRSYQLQTATNLPAASWLNLGTAFPGTSGVLTTNIPIGSESVKYFRLQSSD